MVLREGVRETERGKEETGEQRVCLWALLFLGLAQLSHPPLFVEVRQAQLEFLPQPNSVVSQAVSHVRHQSRWGSTHDGGVHLVVPHERQQMGWSGWVAGLIKEKKYMKRAKQLVKVYTFCVSTRGCV
jgi:hypothetical protein